MTKKKIRRTAKWKFWLISLLVIIILFGIFYAWGSVYYQKEKQIDRITSSLSNPNANLAEYVTPSDPDIDVTNKSLKPLQSYFKENPRAKKQLVHDLKNGQTSNQITLINSGSHFLLFPKYTIRVQVYRPQIETNHPDSKLQVNGKNLGVMNGSGQNFYQDLGLVFPGRYHIVVNTKVGKRPLTANSVVNIWSDKTVDMTIRTATFQVRSVPKGNIFINDKKVATLDSHGQYVFKNYRLAKNMELYIQSTYKGKRIKSEKVKDIPQSIDKDFSNTDDGITDYGNAPDYQGNQEKDVYQDVDGDYIVNPNWPGLINDKAAAKLIGTNFKKPDKNDFVKGKKNPSFNKLKQQVRKLKFSLPIKKVKIAVDVYQVLPAGDNYGDVSYKVVYKYKKNGKNAKKLVSYQHAIFHDVDNKQLIKTLGQRK